jgi:membrane protein required for colicin V production
VTFVDWIVVTIVVLSAGLAWMRGFVRELLSIGGWITAGFATLFGLPLARPFANEKIGDPLFADIAAGVVIFVAALIVCSIIGHFISKRVQGSMLGPVDRSLGLLFGLARGRCSSPPWRWASTISGRRPPCRRPRSPMP